MHRSFNLTRRPWPIVCALAFVLSLALPHVGQVLVARANVVPAPPAVNDPRATTGEWAPVINWGIFGKHMAMLPNGKVLAWPTGQDAFVWDPATQTKVAVPANFGDLHCAAQTFLSDGRVIVADRENSRVQSFTADGELLAVWDAFLRPQDVVADAEDRIYVCDSIPTLSLLSADGALLGRCRPVLNGAHGLWLGPAGDIFLAETNPNRITRLFPVTG